MALETTNIEYDTVRIDNTGPGRKPPYWRGNTPQMRWPDGSNQNESIDLVKEVDKLYGNNMLYPNDIKNELINKAREFQNIFPSGSRPSSRAAFLFGWSGEPLFKSEFESTLLKLNCKKAKKKISWHSVLTFKENIRMTIEWYRAYYNVNKKVNMKRFSENQIKEFTKLILKRSKK